MANREQRSNKEAKKPKKSSAPNKPVTAATVPAPITTVILRGAKQRSSE
jgi:hypothetical protein